MQSCGVHRPSVRPSVRLYTFCANRFFYQTNGWIATKLAHDGPQIGLHQEVLKVTVEVKGHVLRALFSDDENRFFSQANDWIATKLAHDGSQRGLHPGCAQGHGRGQRSRDTGTFLISRKSLLLAGK